MAKQDGSLLRPWPFLAAAVVCFTSGTALLSSEEGRTAAGEALIIMGIVLIGSWITMQAAQSPMEAVRGWRERPPRPPNDPPGTRTPEPPPEDDTRPPDAPDA